jgi:hypothetical protein
MFKYYAASEQVKEPNHISLGFLCSTKFAFT